MRISIIIPAHNEEEVIERSIKSVQKNTYKNIEIIVSNDGSKDKTKEIVESLMKNDKRIKLINREEGTSAAFARNRGAEVATGNILIFLDADSWINDVFLEEVTKKFNSFKNIDAVITICLPLRDNFMSKVLSGFLAPPFKTKLKEGKIYDNTNHEKAGTMFFCLTKKSYKKIKGYSESLFYFEDEEFSRKFYSAGYKSTLAKKAIQYFELPSSFGEFLRQCKWIGKGTNSIKKRKEKRTKKSIWFLKSLFLIFPLFFLWNISLFLIALVITGGISYLSLVKRNKKIFLSIIMLPFLYIKTFLVSLNILRFWK